MALLASHLEQIEFCASTISELPFPGPGIFTNALLPLPDITRLLRDPDVHERALFSVVPSQQIAEPASSNGNRAGTGQTELSFRKNNAVPAVLGADMAERIRRQRAGDAASVRRRTGNTKDEVDIELLLNGAEKLCKAYPLSGVTERIAALRARHDKVAQSTQHYETLLAEQAEQLSKISQSSNYAREIDEDEPSSGRASRPVTEEDLRRDEEQVKELESRKRSLEERVDGMKKDLGGILR